MILHWPQITILLLMMFNFGISASKHGEQKKGSENFLVTVVANVLMLWLLYEGGFFSQVMP